MAHVIVPGNFTQILTNPATPPDISQDLIEDIQSKTPDTFFILGQESFLHLVRSERSYINIYLDFDISNTHLNDAGRLAEYLIRFNLPTDTRTLNIITGHSEGHDRQDEQCTRRFLQTVVYHLDKSHYHPRITYQGQLIKPPRFMQQPSRVFGFFARTFNRYGEPQHSFIHATSDMDLPDDTAKQTRSSPKSPKPH